MLKKSFLFALAVASGATATLQASETQKFKFTDAGLDPILAVENYSQAPLDALFYAAKFSMTPGWNVRTVSNENESSAAVCAAVATQMAEGASPDAWLYLPALTVETGDALQWTARSLAHDLKDSYQIMYSLEDTLDPTKYMLLSSVAEESYYWTTRSISLDDFAGKTVRLAFVSNKPGYMLAIRELQLGLPAMGLKATNTGRRFYSPEIEPRADFSVADFGVSAAPVEFEAVVDLPSESRGRSLGKVAAGEKRDGLYSVSIPLDMQCGEAFKYTIQAKLADGKTVKAGSEYANFGDYTRKVLIEKFTGTWCNACAKAIYVSHIYEHQLGEEGVYLEAHSPGTGGIDRNGVPEYIASFKTEYGKTFNYPTFWLNRSFAQEEYLPFDRSAYEKAMMQPCTAGIELEVLHFDGKTLSARAIVESAAAIDNADGKYRVGFVLSEDNVRMQEGAFPQQNLATGSSTQAFGEFNYLPKYVPASMTVMQGVVAGPSDGGTGIAGSLPASIEARTRYEVPFEMEVPATVSDIHNLQLTALFTSFVDKNNYPVLNCDRQPLRIGTGIAGIEKGAASISVKELGDALAVALPSEEAYDVKVYDILGNCIGAASGSGAQAKVSVAQSHKGVLLVSARQGGANYVAKIIRR